MALKIIPQTKKAVIKNGMLTPGKTEYDDRFGAAVSAYEQYRKELPDGFRLIIEYRNTPVGYGQVYQLSGEQFSEYDYPDNGSIVFAADQFIGEPEYWNRGIGSSFLRMAAAYLRTRHAADVLLVDPHQNNHRAVRAYEKAGFRIIRALPEHELFEGKMEDCWLMEKRLGGDELAP